MVLETLLEQVPPYVIEFVLVVLFSFSIGIERRTKVSQQSHLLFGSDRTFTLIGILGYLLLIADSVSLIPYLLGFFIVGILMSIYYYARITKNQMYGITSIILVLITYGFPLFIHKTSLWLSLLLFVTVLVLSEVKKPLHAFVLKIDGNEIATLAKFIIITGIILPILPQDNIHQYLPVSPYKIWLAVVVVSIVSYISYLLQTYVFPKSGLLLTAILGGLYSSTVSTIILSKRSRQQDELHYAYAGAIIIATAMMFLRVYILILIFIPKLALPALPYMVFMFLVSLLTGLFIYKKQNQSVKSQDHSLMKDKNPLEFKVALVFAALYILFTVIIQLVFQYFGESGLYVLSVVVGFGDIAPFLLNLFQGSYTISIAILLIATLQATASNNILKSVYSYILSGKQTKKIVLKGFGIVMLCNIVVVTILYML